MLTFLTKVRFSKWSGSTEISTMNSRLKDSSKILCISEQIFKLYNQNSIGILCGNRNAILIFENG